MVPLPVNTWYLLVESILSFALQWFRAREAACSVPLLGHLVCGHPRLFAFAVVLVRLERRHVTGCHGVVANASLQKSGERVPVGPIGAAGVPLERVRLRRLVDLNRVSHVVVVDVGRARDDLVRVIGLGL